LRCSKADWLGKLYTPVLTIGAKLVLLCGCAGALILVALRLILPLAWLFRSGVGVEVPSKAVRDGVSEIGNLPLRLSVARCSSLL
jgi:hypothetical protein